MQSERRAVALLPSSCCTAIQGCATPSGLNGLLPGPPFALAHWLQKFRSADAERIRKRFQSRQPRIVAAPLDIADVRAPEAGFVSQLILRPLRNFPERANVRAQ